MTPYECLHVPVQAATTVRLLGVPLWVLQLAVGVLLWHLYGPWVFLAPALLLAVIAGTAALIVWWRRRTDADPQGVGIAGTDTAAYAADVTDAGQVAGGWAGLVCLGCGRSAAAGMLAIAGYRIPVCDPCRVVAEGRITAGVVRALR